MIKLKSKDEIAQIKIACKALSTWMSGVLRALESLEQLDGITLSKHFIHYVQSLSENNNKWKTIFDKQDYKPATESYGFPICISINDEILHGRPDNRPFKKGDVIKIDAGLSYNGWCADMARTVVVGDISSTIQNLVAGCREALDNAITVCMPGNKLGDISRTIQETAVKHKLGIVIDYTGHGIGKSLHEEPNIYNVSGIMSHLDKIILRPGMVLCIEPMFTLGGGAVVLDSDGWKVITQDGSLSAHFEDQIVITQDGCEVLTNKELSNV